MLDNILMIRPHTPQIKAHLAAGMQVTVINYHPLAERQQDVFKADERVRVIGWRQSPIPGRNFIRLTTKTISALEELHYDVIHVNALQEILQIQLAMQLCSSQNEPPLVVTMGHGPDTWKGTLRTWISIQLIRYFSDGFIALSSKQLSQVQARGVEEEKTTFIPNPYDADWLHHVQQEAEMGLQEQGSGRIVYPAALSPRKDQAALIRAAAQLRSEGLQATIYLLGEAPRESRYQEELSALVKEYQLINQVVFTGHLPHIQVGRLLAESDVVAFPTRGELMPRAVIEGMVLAKPVIASAVDGILDLIEDGKNGLLISPGDVNELSRGLRLLLENPGLAEQLGQQAEQFVLAKCSPEAVGTSFLDFYRRRIEQMD